MGHIFGMIARWMDAHEMPGWVTFGPNGKALAWAPTERTIRAMRRRIDGAHDYARCSDGFVPLADIWQRDIGEEAAVQASDRAFMIGEGIYVAALLIIATIVTVWSLAYAMARNVHTYGYARVITYAVAGQDRNGARHADGILGVNLSPNAGLFVKLPGIGACGTDLWFESGSLQPFCGDSN